MQLTLAQWVLLGGVDLGTKLMQLQNRKYTKTIVKQNEMVGAERTLHRLPTPCALG
jgi:hypothetical protein